MKYLFGPGRTPFAQPWTPGDAVRHRLSSFGSTRSIKPIRPGLHLQRESRKHAPISCSLSGAAACPLRGQSVEQMGLSNQSLDPAGQIWTIGRWLPLLSRAEYRGMGRTRRESASKEQDEMSQ